MNPPIVRQYADQVTVFIEDPGPRIAVGKSENVARCLKASTWKLTLDRCRKAVETLRGSPDAVDGEAPPGVANRWLGELLRKAEAARAGTAHVATPAQPKPAQPGPALSGAPRPRPVGQDNWRYGHGVGQQGGGQNVAVKRQWDGDVGTGPPAKRPHVAAGPCGALPPWQRGCQGGFSPWQNQHIQMQPQMQPGIRPAGFLRSFPAAQSGFVMPPQQWMPAPGMGGKGLASRR